MEKTSGSRLLQMQARFQQKQMAEREMKIASLYEAQQARALDRVRHSPSVTNGSSVTSSPPAHVPVPAGKVRQMFEERRTKKGIDKSYPLQPIHNTDRNGARKPVTNGYSKPTTNKTVTVEKKPTRTHTTHAPTVKKQYGKSENNNLVNGSGDLNHNHLNLNHNKHSVFKNGNFLGDSVDEVDRDSYLLQDETFPEALAPAQTPRSPEPKKPPRRNASVKKAPVPEPAPVAPPRRAASENKVQVQAADGTKGREVMKQAAKPITKKQPVVLSTSKPRAGTTRTASATAESATDGASCGVCGRKFAPDRIQKHEVICRKTSTKKRKPFDVVKHRLAGTEAEPFINKVRKGAASTTKASKPLNSNWRQKHNEFIQAIRAAKQVQAHIAAGGKLSDLPPPPPSENPDYIQCPHCTRRFNQAAAERHIPKCANFQFNKPKPAARKR